VTSPCLTAVERIDIGSVSIRTHGLTDLDHHRRIRIVAVFLGTGISQSV